MIVWIILGVGYFAIAVAFIRMLSYCCCITHGVYEYSFLSVLFGLFWPIYLIYSLIGGLWENS